MLIFAALQPKAVILKSKGFALSLPRIRFCLVTQRSSQTQLGGALCDYHNNGCEGDKHQHDF